VEKSAKEKLNMLKKLLELVFVLTLGISTIVAQSQQSTVSTDEAWEYLMVSTSSFNDKENIVPPEKWMGRRQGNTGFLQETSIQNEFDRLGKLGWELVGILPMNSGEQGAIGFAKFIFKRRLNAARSLVEAEELKKLIVELNARKPRDPDFVDLDKAEIISKDQQTSSQIKKKLEEKLKSITKFSVTDIKTTASISPNFKTVRGEITVDGSRILLKDDNKYRSSEVNSFIRQVADEVYKVVGLQPRYDNDQPFEDNIYNQNGNGTFIQIKITVNSNGKIQTLAEGKVQGNWSEVNTQ
jgi:hypothetical protein